MWKRRVVHIESEQQVRLRRAKMNNDHLFVFESEKCTNLINHESMLLLLTSFKSKGQISMSLIGRAKKSFYLIINQVTTKTNQFNDCFIIK